MRCVRGRSCEKVGRAELLTFNFVSVTRHSKAKPFVTDISHYNPRAWVTQNVGETAHAL
jgi:hypothetical protein